MLSHMVVKLSRSNIVSVTCLRVVLSHMVVKLEVSIYSSNRSLRVVLSHMVVKRGLSPPLAYSWFESSVISYGSQTRSLTA